MLFSQTIWMSLYLVLKGVWNGNRIWLLACPYVVLKSTYVSNISDATTHPFTAAVEQLYLHCLPPSTIAQQRQPVPIRCLFV